MLTSLSEIKAFLQQSSQPVFYVSRSATNLLGLDRWIGNFHFITLRDSWDGAHLNAFAPKQVPPIPPRSNTDVVNWLLENTEVQQYIADHTPSGETPQVAITMFDEHSESICASVGYELIMPSHALRRHLDSKLVTTQLGNTVGISSVPNVLSVITGWDDLRHQAQQAGLGKHLVIQLPFGDSGRTTYFVSEEGDYEPVKTHITGTEIKIMKRIEHLALATEAVITRAGTVVGPVLREITGHPELTRYRGGWAGSELYPGLVSPEAHKRVHQLVEQFATALRDEGYRGILEVSTLLDLETDEVYLGELNPRISGSSAHSNLTPGETTLPLFAYHVLEYANVGFVLDLPEIRTERDCALRDETVSTLVVQYPGVNCERVTQAPRTGRYRVSEDGSTLTFLSNDLSWQQLTKSDEVFWLRNVGPGEVRDPGTDLGMLMTRTRSQEDDYALTDAVKRLIPALQHLYSGTKLSQIQKIWRTTVRLLRALFDHA